LLGYCAFSPTTQTPYITDSRDEFGNEIKPNVSYPKKQGEEAAQTQEAATQEQEPTPEPEVREMGLDAILKDEVKSDASYIYNIMKASLPNVGKINTINYCPPREGGNNIVTCTKDKHYYGVGNVNEESSGAQFTFEHMPKVGWDVQDNVRYIKQSISKGGWEEYNSYTYAEKMQAVRIFASAFKPEYERELVKKLSVTVKTLKRWKEGRNHDGAFSSDYSTTFEFHGTNVSVEYGPSIFRIAADDGDKM
jgi:hypothetical protein